MQQIRKVFPLRKLLDPSKYTRGFNQAPKILLQRTMKVRCGDSLTKSDVGISQKTESSDDIASFFNKLTETLTLDNNGTKPTSAENQLDTLRYYLLLTEKGFTSVQTNLIIQLMLSLINEQFFYGCNSKFLRNMELENQSYLFNAAESELRYFIQTSREVSLNEKNLQLMKLNRELNLYRDELNELIINLLKKDSRVDFNDHQCENTLLHRNIKIRLKECNNKIGTKIIGQMKFEVENLRWETTRNGLFTMLFLVFFIMSGVSISRHIWNDKPIEVMSQTAGPEEIKLSEAREIKKKS